jgi:putative FmdB family regulatory protein
MPFYDLRCGACGHEYESMLAISEAPTDEPVRCPKCNKKKVRVAIKKAPAYHNHYSPLHPRRNRGRGY